MKISRSENVSHVDSCAVHLHGLKRLILPSELCCTEQMEVIGPSPMTLLHPV